MGEMKEKKIWLFAMGVSADLIIAAAPSIVLAIIPQPARIGGTVTVDGVQLNRDTDTGFSFAVTNGAGTPYLDNLGAPAQDTDGLNASNLYIIDIPVYEATDQPKGAHPAEKAVISVHKDGKNLPVIYPVNGVFAVPNSGFVKQVDLNIATVPPGKANLVTPSGAIATDKPAYTWDAVSNSTWYCLWVQDSTGNRLNQWYASSQVGCAAGTGTCSATSDTTLTVGSAGWWIQTWNAHGLGPWSDGMSFTVPLIMPGKLTLISPSGAISTNWATYSWNADAHTTWYRLWVKDSNGSPIDNWYKAADVGCSGGSGQCSVVTGTVLAAGSAKWWVQTWNSNGSGPLSDGMDFTVPAPVLSGKVTPISPSGAINTNWATYTWNADAHTTWYHLWVMDSNGTPIDRWYKAEEAGCSGGSEPCSVVTDTVLAAGSAKWWVQTWNPNGPGPWSDSMAFTVPAPTLPGKTTLIAPSGTISTNTPAYTWNAVPNSTWYYLYVNDSTGTRIKQWYTDVQSGCAGGTGTCSITPGTALAPGSALWWVDAWNPNGFGPWSDGMAFVAGLTSGSNE
jgi:hypothetical protein